MSPIAECSVRQMCFLGELGMSMSWVQMCPVSVQVCVTMARYIDHLMLSSLFVCATLVSIKEKGLQFWCEFQ